jgi:hypothetical protein
MEVSGHLYILSNLPTRIAVPIPAGQMLDIGFRAHLDVISNKYSYFYWD